MDHSDRTDKDDGNSTDKRTTALNSGTTSTGSVHDDEGGGAAGRTAPECASNSRSRGLHVDDDAASTMTTR